MIDFRDSIDARNAQKLLDVNGIIASRIVSGEIDLRFATKDIYTLDNCDVVSLKVSLDKPLLTLSIEKCNIQRINIDKQTRIGHIEIKGESKIGSIYFERGCECKELVIEDRSEISSVMFLQLPEEIEFKNGVKINSLRFNGAVSKGKIYFFKANVNDIEFIQCQFDKLVFQNTDINSLRCSKVKISEIDVTYSASCKDFLFDDGEVTDLSFLQLSKFKETDISITNSRIDNLSLGDYYNKGKFKFINSNVNKSIQITNSELSNGIFNGVDWPKAKIDFNRSHISKCNFFNIGWPEDYRITEVIRITDKESEDRLWEDMDSYRQLKFAYQSQQNYFEAAKFRYNELRLYYQLMHYYTWHGFHLNSLRSWWNQHRKSWWKYFGEFLILWTSKKGSNFGESVGLPLYQMIKFHLIFFTLLVLSNDTFPVQITSPQEHNWQAFSRGVKIFIFTMNPAHPFMVDNIPIYGLVDTMMRISSGYFIYYFLKASRKFHLT